MSSIQYAAHGAIRGMTVGTKYEETCFNNRLQPVSIRLGTATTSGTCVNPGTDLLNLTLGYGPAASNNGNLMSQTIASAGLPAAVTQNYTYDGVNRLKTGQETGGWLQTYVYDALGNRALVSGTQYYIPGGTWTPQVPANDASLVPPLFPNNRWTGAQYDNGTPNSVGNQTALPGYAFTYDAENRQVTSTINSVTATYSYDGDGRRVKKVQGSATTVYVYDAGGNLAAEYSTQPETPPCTTCYLTADHLGSTRLMTDGTTGLPKALHDYLPFGEEIPSGIGGRSSLYGTDSPRQRFTGKERDSETSLDYFGARYFSGAQGRFTSPDPVKLSARHLLLPQRWNEYAYVRNNPLAFIDPDGAADFAVFDAFRDSDLSGGRRPNWVAIKRAAERRGHRVTIYPGERATEAAFQTAISTPGMNVIHVGHSVEPNSTTAAGVRLSDGAVGAANVTSNGVPMTPPEGVTAGSVSIFACNSITLDSQYSGAQIFTGINSGADATNSLTLERTGEAFLTSATSRAADQAVDLAAAARAAQTVLSNSTQQTPLVPGVSINIDKGDKVVQRTCKPDGTCR